MGAGRAGGQCVQSKQSLQLLKQAAHSCPGIWLPQPRNRFSSCSISPGPGCSVGTGCTAQAWSAPVHLWAEHPSGWSPLHLCTAGCSTSLAQYQSLASCIELCCCRAAQGAGTLVRRYSIHPVTTRSMG